jgi:hypothetical protein
VAAFLCLAQNANAQYIPNQIHRAGAGFVDEHHRILSDNELIDAVGIDIFEDTVLGARKQYNAGRKLITGGAIGLGAGLVGTLAGAAFIAASGATYYEQGQTRYEIVDDGCAIAGASLLALGISAMTAGSAALSAGIPLKVIGQSRLNWVENDYNERQDYSLHVGAAPHGIGLTLQF